MKLPFVRGLVLLYDTIVTGTRWLVRSATLQALEMEDGKPGPTADGTAGAAGTTSALLTLAMLPAGPAFCAAAADGAPAEATEPAQPTPAPSGAATGMGKGYNVAVGGMLLMALVFGIGLFFLVPLALAQATVGRVDQGIGLQFSEGLIRVVMFIGYLLIIGRAADIRRTFQYHGAEHMSIHTLEAGDPLTVEAARKYPTAHPRCGTEFLVVVLLVSIVAFSFLPKLSPIGLIASRVLLVPVIAAVSYEILQFGARRRNRRIVRWLWAPGIWVQAITTRQPSDDMIEVAIVSLERALISDGNELPAGSSDYAARPLNPETDFSAGDDVPKEPATKADAKADAKADPGGE
jgi:uncharacterized protein YqhQ